MHIQGHVTNANNCLNIQEHLQYFNGIEWITNNLHSNIEEEFSDDCLYDINSLAWIDQIPDNLNAII